jgi:hypothetical protein
LVGQDVAKEIGGGDEAVAVGIARDRRAEGIDADQLQLNVPVFGVQPFEGADEEAFGLRECGPLMDHREAIDIAVAACSKAKRAKRSQAGAVMTRSDSPTSSVGLNSP